MPAGSRSQLWREQLKEETVRHEAVHIIRKKEARHILRDKRTMLFGIPVVMMLLFGFTIFVEGICTVFVSG